jgi:aspartyl-tRNA(Asn)/glutamyl-tRNA(Gln) amidotransferase subunit B
MHSPEEAGNFARELQLLLRYLGASEANMEKGEMRVEANVSVAKKGERSAAYVEIKNLNSFRTMERAVAYEIKRQTQLLETGGKLEKQTLGWDENKGCTFPQRSKEGSADYRYFPDPDLPSLRISEVSDFSQENIDKSLPELPGARRNRYLAMGIKQEDADAYVRQPELGNYFDKVVTVLSTQATLFTTASNYITNDLVNFIRDSEDRDTENKEKIRIHPQNFAKLMELVGTKKISSRATKDLMAALWENDSDPELLAKEKGLLVVLDTAALENTIREVLAENPTVAAEYRSGKVSVMEFMLGQCMKKLRGAGDPFVIREELKKALS